MTDPLPCSARYWKLCVGFNVQSFPQKSLLFHSRLILERKGVTLVCLESNILKLTFIRCSDRYGLMKFAMGRTFKRVLFFCYYGDLAAKNVCFLPAACVFLGQHWHSIKAVSTQALCPSRERQWCRIVWNLVELPKTAKRDSWACLDCLPPHLTVFWIW